VRVRAAPRKQDKSDQAHSHQENCGIFRGRNVSSDTAVLNRIVPDSATCGAVAGEEINCGRIGTGEVDLAPLDGNTGTLLWRMRSMTPGTGSITKAFICSNGLARMIAFGYDDRNSISS
jgi:hypothetical protein